MKTNEFNAHHRRFLHKAFRTKFSSLNVDPEKSVYYWWWIYLKHNEDYRRCCERGGKGKHSAIYKDFGDIHNVDFQRWWVTDGRGEYLFAEQLPPMRLNEIKSTDEWNPEWTADNVMVIALPLTESKRLLKRRFDQLLKRRHKGIRGKPTKDKSDALYKVRPRFSIHALEQMMKVYELRQAEPDLTLAEIGRALNICPSAMPKKTDDPSATEIKRNTMSAAVSRYLRKAEAIIKNATDRNKLFPCTDE